MELYVYGISTQSLPHLASHSKARLRERQTNHALKLSASSCSAHTRAGCRDTSQAWPYAALLVLRL